MPDPSRKGETALEKKTKGRDRLPKKNAKTKKPVALCEAALVFLMAAAILASQLIGNVNVIDTSHVETVCLLTHS